MALEVLFRASVPMSTSYLQQNLGRLVIFGQQLMYNRPFTAALGKELFKLCLLSSLSVNFLWVVAVLFAFGWTPGSILFLSNLGFLVSSICLFLKMALSPVSSPLPLTGISTFGETSVNQKFKNLRHFLISFINFSPLPLVLTSEFGPSFHPAPFCVLFLPCHLIPPFRPSVPCKTIWSPSKVQGFLWKLALRRGPTIDITQSFNPHLTLFPNSCPLCLYAEESNDHLFLHCRFS